MTIIIDGNNLLHKIPHLKKLFFKDMESAQSALIETIKSHKSKGDKIMIIFDGSGKISKPEVIYSKKITADEVIRNKIENFTNSKLLKIVSSDHEIINFAKICGCQVMRSEDFWKKLSSEKSPANGKNINQNYIYEDHEKPERLSRKEIDEFKKYFS